jgi:hypothetical protein
MNKLHSFTALALLASLTVTPLALGQSSPAAQAARLQKLQQQQAAVLARVKANQAAAASAAAAAAATAVPTTAPTPVATVVPKPAPTTVATVAPTATVAPPKPTTAASASAAPATSGSVAPVASAAPVAAPLALNLDELKKTRTNRRHAEVVDLQSRWGSLLSDPRSAPELKLHAQRSAYLQRIRALAEKANDATFVKSVDALITKEDSRDADAMNALRSGALPAGIAVAAPAAAPVAGAAK